MSNKLKIVGLRNLPLEGEIENQKDYKVSVIAALDEIRTRPTQGEEVEDKIFVLKTLYVDGIEGVSDHKEVKVQKGFSKSQALRFAIKDYLKRIGKDANEEGYEAEMNKVIKHFNSKE